MSKDSERRAKLKEQAKRKAAHATKRAENTELPQQPMANALYEQLYQDITAAKAAADAEGKPFAVVIAEQHNDRGAALVELMAVDILQQLKVGNVVFEQDEAQVAKTAGEAQGNLAQSAANARAAARLELPKGDAALAAAAVHLRKVFHDSPEFKHSVSGSQIVLMATVAKGMKAIGGDPNKVERSRNRDLQARGLVEIATVQEAERLDGDMAKALLDTARQGGAAGIYGALHVPGIKRALERDGASVLVINTREVTPQDRRENLPDFAKLGYERLAEERVTKPGFPVDFSDILQLSLEASLAHRIAHGDAIAGQQQKALRRAIDEGKGRA